MPRLVSHPRWRTGMINMGVDSVNVYLVPSSMSLRLSRLTQAEVGIGHTPSRLECTFPNPKAKQLTKPRKKSVKKQLVGLTNEENGELKSAGEDERGDVGDLDLWDGEEEDDEAELEEEVARIEEASEEEEMPSSEFIGEKENGWKVIHGNPSKSWSSKGTAGSRKRVKTVSDSE